MIKLLYAIAKAIPALQKILDKFFGEGRELSASKRHEAKDDMVDNAIADALASPNERVRSDETKQQRKTNKTSGIQKSRVSVPRIRRRSPQDSKSSGV
jgi:hypothetical protein